MTEEIKSNGSRKLQAGKVPSNNIQECVLVLVEVCRIYGFKGETDIDQTVQHWEKCIAECHWMKFCKYKLAAFFSFHTGQPLPPKPFNTTDKPETIIGGRAGRWLRLYLKHQDEEGRLSLLFSIKMTKKGMPRPGKLEVKAAVDQFRITITTPSLEKSNSLLTDWSKSEDLHPDTPTLLCRSNVEDQLKRTVKELLGKQTYTARDRVSTFFPSTSACFGSSRLEGGVLGELLREWENEEAGGTGVGVGSPLKNLRRPGGYLPQNTSFKSKQVWTTTTRFGTRTHHHTTSTKGQEERLDEEEVKIEAFIDSTELEKVFERFWLNLLAESSKMKTFPADPVGLAEALKNRVITKSISSPQLVMRSLWKKLHSVLKVHKTFTLLAQPEVDSERLLNWLGTNLAEDEAYLSGDYSAATDNLESWVSNCIANAIADELKLFEVERRLLVSQLTGFSIQVEDGTVVSTPTGDKPQKENRMKPQARGQLMGSVVSFPVLCIANAAISRWAYEVGGLKRRLTLLRDCPLTINGDDMLMRTTANGREAWSKIAAFCGLEESIGKTYFSRDFVEINSTMFRRDEDNPFLLQSTKGRELITRRSPFHHVPFVNIGLMRGLKRSGGSVGLKDLTSSDETIGSRYREMLTRTPPHLKPQVHSRFIEYHKPILTDCGLAWYIPEWLGGVGLTGYAHPSEIDLRLCRRTLLHWKEQRPIQPKTNETWKTWQVAERRVPAPFIVKDRNNSGISLYTSRVQLECINMLFDSNIKLSDLMETSERVQKKRILNYNRRFWKVTGDLPPPMTEEEIRYQRDWFSYKMDQRGERHVVTMVREETLD